MIRLLKRMVFCLALTAAVWCGWIFAQRQQLNTQLIRFHVVANSDTVHDQAVKLQVRDAVLGAFQDDLSQLTDMEQAKAYLQENLPKIQQIANSVLRRWGMEPDAVVSLCREWFDVRRYDTFSLPSGVYEALRIELGQGQGHNWWCVAFPTLCLGATAQEFSQTAAVAGFDPALRQCLAGEQGYELRFFLLDALGQLEGQLFDR